VLKLMEKNSLDLDESVAPFLPKEWDLHSSIEGLTFRDLMTQRSGLKNANLAIFRVMK
jgi:CubicO group peptidase (beta-lactamase class C family)